MEADQHRVAAAVVCATRERRAAEAAQLAAIAEFAEVYRVDTEALVPVLAERRRRIGAGGTPPVSEFAALELAGLLGCSPWVAGARMIEALDLKHRHPCLFEAVLDLEVEAFRAVRAASICTDLSLELAEQVVQRWLPLQERLGTRAAFTLLERLVIEADRQLAADKEALARSFRGVQVSGLANGCLQLSGTVDVLDGRYFDLSLDRMAHLLVAEYPELDAQARRAKAVGVLANPALALALLQRAAQPELPMTQPSDAKPSDAQPGEAQPATRRWPAIDPLSDSGHPGTPVARPRHAAGRSDVSGENSGANAAGPPAQARRPPPISSIPGVELHTSGTGTPAGSGSADPGPDPSDLQWSDPHREPSGHLCGTIDAPLRTLLPRLGLAVHIHSDALGELTGAARVDRAGWITTQLLRQLLGEVQLKVQPVIDLADTPAEDHYVPTTWLRNAVELAMPHELFPYSNHRSPGLDLDHCVAYRSGEPGQTRLGNLVPLTRRAHRAKTLGAWRSRQRGPDLIDWTSPLGFQYAVTPQGTCPFDA